MQQQLSEIIASAKIAKPQHFPRGSKNVILKKWHENEGFFNSWITIVFPMEIVGKGIWVQRQTTQLCSFKGEIAQ